MVTTAYLRVSTDSQDLQKNKAEISLFANEKHLGHVHWIEETISGRVNWRQRAIARVIDSASAGDVLIVSELSRLGRSMLEIMEILAVATQKGLKIYALKGNWALDGSLQSKVVAMAFAMASEIERDLISARTKESLAARKKSGQSLGRPKGTGKSKLDAYGPEIRALLANGSTVTFVAKRYSTTPANVHRWLKAHGVKRSD
jgi:DNA invertase Pin-like site-specific DNA recombinase